MKTYLLLAFYLLFLIPASAQITFQKTYGGLGDDHGFVARQTADGGYIILGITQDSVNAGSYNTYLIKTDALGDTLWTKIFVGSNGYGGSLEKTIDGGYIITGNTLNILGFDNAYIVKTDRNGNTIWAKMLDSFFYPNSSIQQTTDGGYIVWGVKGVFDSEVHLVKTNAMGDTLWTKAFGLDEGFSVQQTMDGGYIVCGGGGTDMPTLDLKLNLIKTDAVGDTLWTKTFNGLLREFGYSIQQTTDSGYIIVGTNGGAAGTSENIHLLKTDANGDILWTKTYGGIDYDIGSSVQETSDGGYIIAGTTLIAGVHDDVYLIRTNIFGDTLWTKTFGGTGGEEIHSVQQSIDGGFIICGITRSFGMSGYDIFLIKTDGNGNSGCNQGNAPIIVSTRAMQIIDPAITVSSGGIAITPYVPVVRSSSFIVTTLCSTTDIKEATKDNSFLVSPNPVLNELTIENVPRGKRIFIYNVHGKLMLETKGTGQSINLDIEHLPSGVYFVNAEGMKTEKVVKF